MPELTGLVQAAQAIRSKAAMWGAGRTNAIYKNPEKSELSFPSFSRPDFTGAAKGLYLQNQQRFGNVFVKILSSTQ
jgi:hypothetical protein